jgi:hypothetical protein
VAKLVVVSRKLAMGPAWAAWSVLRGLALGLLFGVLKLVSVWWSVAKLVVVSRKLAMGPAWAAWSVLRGLALELLFGVLKLVSVWWSVAKLVVVSRRLAMGLAADLACLQAPGVEALAAFAGRLQVGGLAMTRSLLAAKPMSWREGKRT